MEEQPKIPNRLKKDAFRFVKVRGGKKYPFEDNWQEDNNYRYDDEEILEHLKQGGNYGIVAGYGDLIVIDADTQHTEKIVERQLPKTFKVRTGGGGAHYYYQSNLEENLRLGKGDEGDIQAVHKCVVGPTSLHPSGDRYRIEQDREIAWIEKQRVKEVFKWEMSSANLAKIFRLIERNWEKGHRQYLALYSAGFLRKCGLTEHDVKRAFKRICERKNDEEMKQRLRAVERTFEKEYNEVTGVNGLEELFGKDFVEELLELAEGKWHKEKQEEITLHKAGGVEDFLVYEPLGAGRYVYHTKNGTKGITEVKKFDDENGPPSFYLEIEGEKYHFDGKPLLDPDFRTPPLEKVEKWVEGKKDVKTSKELKRALKRYFKIFLDLPMECYYDALTLFVFQSWLRHFLNSVFYVAVIGEFGGGKTATGEAVTLPCYHGHQTGNPSPALVGRFLEKQKVTLFTDELDSLSGTDDSELYQVIRQGYRKGGTYERVNPETLNTQHFNVFGPKIFSIHSDYETALKTRTLPIQTRETSSEKPPVLSYAKRAVGGPLHTEMFLWYMEHAFELREKLVEQVEVIDHLSEGGGTLDSLYQKNDGVVSELQNRIFDQLTLPLTEGQVNQLAQRAGRNIELSYLIYCITNALDINLNKAINTLFEEKKEIEAEVLEIGYKGVLKDLLREKYREYRDKEDYQTQSGFVKVANKELYRAFNNKLQDEFGQGVSPPKFKGYLRDFGFTRPISRKKLKVKLPDEQEPQSRLCNIFTKRVLRKIGLRERKGAKTAEVTSEQTKDSQEGKNAPPHEILQAFYEKHGDGSTFTKEDFISYFTERGVKEEVAEQTFQNEYEKLGHISKPKPGKFKVVN